MILLTLGSLLVILTLSIAGIFYPRFHDNWLQHVGMIVLGVTSVVLIDKVHDAQYLPVEMVFFAVGTALIMAGTAYKVWHFSVKVHNEKTEA